MDKNGVPNLAGSHRFWPSASGMMLIVALSIAGVIGLPASLVAGEWIAALLFGAILLYPLFSFGWIDIEPGRVRQGKLTGGRTVEAHEIHSMKLDYVKSKSTKWWFPVLVLHDEDEVRLTTLKSVSKKKTEEKARMIQIAMNGVSMSGSGDLAPANPPPPAPSHEVFTPLPGLEEHYN